MFDIETSLKEFPITTLPAGEVLLVQGEKTNKLYFLIEGDVSVVKDGFNVAHQSREGSVYGEMSVMLDKSHTATVKCVTACKFYYVENPKKTLENNSDVIWHIAKILSMRLDSLNEYLFDYKGQSDDRDKQSVSTNEENIDREKMVNEALHLLQIQ